LIQYAYCKSQLLLTYLVIYLSVAATEYRLGGQVLGLEGCGLDSKSGTCMNLALAFASKSYTCYSANTVSVKF